MRIVYEREGNGSPLVLLHGAFGFDSQSWRRQIDALSDEFTVIAWDMPGCGQSSDPPESFRATDMRESIPNSRLVVIPGVGHMCNIEAPEQFNAEVRQFLHSVPM